MELEVRPFSLRDSVETALAVVADPAATKKVDLVYENQHNDFPDKVLGDVTRFRQILLKYIVSMPTLTLAYWEMPSNLLKKDIYWSSHELKNCQGTLMVVYSKS